MVSGGTGGNPYYNNQLVNYVHLMYSLNFHQAKQGPPHQQTLSDQLQLHATCRPKPEGQGQQAEKQEELEARLLVSTL